MKTRSTSSDKGDPDFVADRTPSQSKTPFYLDVFPCALGFWTPQPPPKNIIQVSKKILTASTVNLVGGLQKSVHSQALSPHQMTVPGFSNLFIHPINRCHPRLFARLQGGDRQWDRRDPHSATPRCRPLREKRSEAQEADARSQARHDGDARSRVCSLT